MKEENDLFSQCVKDGTLVQNDFDSALGLAEL